MAVLVVTGVGMYGQQYPPQQNQRQGYPQQDPRYQGQGDPNYQGQNGQGQNGQGQNGQYDDDQGDYEYDQNDEGIYAPAPPAPPSYGYDRTPMPGPGYYWVDGFWNYRGGRYGWTRGYWMRPPYAGGYWVAPRYTGGRYFGGFWGGGPNRGYVRYAQGYRPGFSAGFAYRGGGGGVVINRGYSGGNRAYQGGGYQNRGGAGGRNSGPGYRGGGERDGRGGRR
jgi:hypothetical protein